MDSHPSLTLYTWANNFTRGKAFCSFFFQFLFASSIFNLHSAKNFFYFTFFSSVKVDDQHMRSNNKKIYSSSCNHALWCKRIFQCFCEVLNVVIFSMSNCMTLNTIYLTDGWCVRCTSIPHTSSIDKLVLQTPPMMCDVWQMVKWCKLLTKSRHWWVYAIEYHPYRPGGRKH